MRTVALPKGEYETLDVVNSVDEFIIFGLMRLVTHMFKCLFFSAKWAADAGLPQHRTGNGSFIALNLLRVGGVPIHLNAGLLSSAFDPQTLHSGARRPDNSPDLFTTAYCKYGFLTDLQNSHSLASEQA